MKKLAALSIIFIMISFAGCGSSGNDGQESQNGISITATQSTAWEGSGDYLEFVIDLGSPNGTSENIVVYFETSGTGMDRDDIDGLPSLQQEYVEIPPGSQSASIRIDGFTSDGAITETQPITLRITGCSSADYPIGPSFEATAVIMDGDGPTVTDIDGNGYRTVLIGAQTWMAENLKTNSFRNGDRINERWCYNNDYNYFDDYGMLYSWYAVMDIRGLAPVGWHVPTEEEWRQLIDYLGGESIAGGKLKATTLWKSPNTGATNESGFTAVPGGFRRNDGSFDGLGERGSFRNAAGDYYENLGLSMVLNYNWSDAFILTGSKTLGFSVRCVRD